MIAHVDMDAFYAAIEVRDDPSLAGKPVIVGGRRGARGVVSAASYEARVFGVHSAMPLATAERLCSRGVFLPVRPNRYRAVSRALMQVLKEYSPRIEPLSLDEAFMDLTGTGLLLGDPVETARRLKTHIRAATGLVASVGLAPSKFTAKVASDLEKPDGLVVVMPAEEVAFLEPLPVSRMWGVGPHTLGRLEELGVRTFGDLARYPPRPLRARLGRAAERMQALARGRDPRSVEPDREARSYSHEVTFGRDEPRLVRLRAVLSALSESVASRLRRDGVCGRTAYLKVRFPDFRTVTRSRTLAEPIDHGPALYGTALGLLGDLNLDGGAVRLIGVGMTGVRSRSGLSRGLFETRRPFEERLDRVLDDLRERHGPRVLRWASSCVPAASGRTRAGETTERVRSGW
jgi:DNA polymerase-4